ncbi:MAG: FAD-dependent oxidoreductase [Mesorhizobium sp.]
MPDKYSAEIACDICIIGAGSAGLSVAAAAAQLGARTVLVERGAMGGDCLNTGCIPSKSLIAAALHARMARGDTRFGLAVRVPRIDFSKVHGRIRRVIETIAPHDSVERFEGLGVQVIKESARFIGKDMLSAGNHRIKARRFVVATGSRPVLPPVPGLAEARPMTNESIFDLAKLPDHLMIIGGGPIGLEMAQAFRRLGSKVTVFDRSRILPKDEPEAAAIARECLTAEGVELLEESELIEVRKSSGYEIDAKVNGVARTFRGSHILVAAGRAPVIAGLGLETAGIKMGERGIEVDKHLTTSNSKVFAIGDVAGGPQFTHIAAYQAGIVVRNALFWLPAKVDYRALPWVTYLDPEIAHVGLTEEEARKTTHSVETLSLPYSQNDRAQTEGRVEGMIKLILGGRGKVLGVTIVGPHAGEAISVWGLVISKRLPLSAVAGMIMPYPTLSEISKRAAGAYYSTRLFSDRVRAVVRFIQRWLP